MPTFTVPSSYGTTMREFNQCHNPSGSPTGGQFCSGPGGGARGPGMVKATSLDHAVALLLQGKRVELGRTEHVNTLIGKLARMALDAKAKGEKAPTYDLCNVSVPGTNKIFCGSKLRTPEYPDGVPREKMPQFGGKAEPGSPADKLPKSDGGNVDGAKAFRAHLASLGIRSSEGSMPAAKLKASQSELVGPKVAGMMTNPKYDPAAEPIFVSRDGYVIDGHHRWAAIVGRDAADGKLGHLKMKVVRVSAPISSIIKIANKWTKKFGILPKEAKEAAFRPSRTRLYNRVWG